jgi:ADP-heptose:LPS heptosyltransferase
MKILIIRFSSIGDIVLTTPLMRNIKKAYPQAKIHFLTKKKYAYLLEANPNIDHFHLLDSDLRDMVFELLPQKFDYIFDLHNNYRSHYVKSMLRQAANSDVKITSVHKLNIKKFLFTKLKLNTLPDKSIVDRYMHTARKLNITNDGQGLDYYIPEESKIEQKDLPMSHSAGYISFVIGGTHTTKKMPVEKWIALAQAIDYPIILQGGQEDEGIGEEIKKLDPIRIYNSCGKFTLHESADIIRYAKVVVTHDTGLMHIAAAFKRNIVSIWGNTSPWFGMFPYFGFNNIKSTLAPNSIIIEQSKLGCRPCSKIGYNACPKKHFKCMNSLEITEIKAAVDLLLKKKD